MQGRNANKAQMQASRGYLRKNQRKEKKEHADLTGMIRMPFDAGSGELRWFSAWMNTEQDNNGNEHRVIRVSVGNPVEDQSIPGQQQRANPDQTNMTPVTARNPADGAIHQNVPMATARQLGFEILANASTPEPAKGERADFDDDIPW